MFLSLGKPVIATGLTTIAGMMCMLSHIIIPAKQLAVLASIGIAYALSASLFFIPAVISIIKNAKPVKSDDKIHIMDRLLNLFADIVIKYPGRIILYFSLIIILLAGGIFLVKIDANPEKYYSDTHPIVVSSKIINNKLGGSQNISILFSGDIKSPDMMKKIDSYENSFDKLEHVGNTASIASAVHEMSKAINMPGEEYYDRIPDSRNAIAQYFELYGMSGDPDDFEKLVDFPYENSHMMVRINNADTPAIKGVADAIRKMTEYDEDIKAIGGWGMIFTDLADHIIKGQFISLFLSITIVSIMMMILFKSAKGGLFSVIPLVMSIILLFSLMGLLKIELNIATALLSSIMIGVGIDYTIHFIWRYREELIKGKNHEDGIRTALTTTGRGIIFNALSVIVGFVVLLFSSFMPVKFFGFLVLISIFACLAGALLFIPALSLKYKPLFLEKNTKDEKNE
jgi:predicted RND superfamily exporter protein